MTGSERPLTEPEREQLRKFAQTPKSGILAPAVIFGLVAVVSLVRINSWAKDPSLVWQFGFTAFLTAWFWLLYSGHRAVSRKILALLQAGDVFLVQTPVERGKRTIVEETVKDVGLQWSFDGEPTAWRQ